MSASILAIDPGSTQSAFVRYRGGVVEPLGIIDNNEAVNSIYQFAEGADTVVIEMVASYGMAVGRQVFETCVWIGRFAQALGGDVEYLYRKDVKMRICGSMRATDSNIRTALIDLFGGSREAAIGKKANPGPLYGIKKDLWAALAVAVAYEKA